ncbi:ROK family protein [Paenibacillus assamensis]|uniref:ROK family protein n=1 Tax=Paenibacillus assamensis TaxID=311244 RepID=UPI00055C16EC|nr:ROK family protein [Paenibacillus assamensis]
MSNTHAQDGRTHLPLQDRIPSSKAREIFRRIRQKHEISKNDLLTKSGLTVSTLTRVLEELSAAGLIEESGFGASTGGRRPILYRTRASYGYCFGLDISRTTSRLAIVDAAGQKIDSISWTMTEHMTPSALIDYVVEQIQLWVAKYRIPHEQCIGLGIGAVGTLDRFTGIIENPQWFYAPGWNDVPIGAELEHRLRIPVLLDNGANTAIIAESWSNRTKGVRYMLYVHAGVGLRSAMMADGKLIHGATDMEGSLGQMIIQADGIPHRTPGGNYGCLDSYATIYAIEREAISKLRTGRPSRLQSVIQLGEAVTFRHIIEALHQQDTLATEIVSQAATYFGIGLANLLNVLHPEKVILGGPLMTSNDLFFYTATQTAIRRTYHYPSYQVVFSKGTYGEEAIAIGAALLVLDNLTSRQEA